MASRPPTRFAQAASSGHARIVTGIISPAIGTWRIDSLNSLGRSAVNVAMKVWGLASRPVRNVMLPDASVVGRPTAAPLGWIAYPGGKTTVTLPPVAPSLPRPHALNDTRLVPIRVARVAAPPGSGISKPIEKVRVAPAASCLPKSIRSRL